VSSGKLPHLLRNRFQGGGSCRAGIQTGGTGARCCGRSRQPIKANELDDVAGEDVREHRELHNGIKGAGSGEGLPGEDVQGHPGAFPRGVGGREAGDNENSSPLLPLAWTLRNSAPVSLIPSHPYQSQAPY
jgi:hypothetical protein